MGLGSMMSLHLVAFIQDPITALPPMAAATGLMHIHLSVIE